VQSVQDVYKSANEDFDAGRCADAIAKYEQVLKEDPAHILSRFNLAVCYAKTGKADEAIAAYRTLLDHNSMIYEAHVNLGLLLEQNGERAEDEEQFERALALHPDDNQAELNLAMFYLRGDEVDKAYPHLTRLAEKRNDSAELYVALSEIEHTRKNETKSREYLEKAIELDSKNLRLIRQLAASYYEEKNCAKATPLFEQLITAEPS